MAKKAVGASALGRLIGQAVNAAGLGLPKKIRAIDIGAGTWDYLGELHRALGSIGMPRGKIREVSLLGIDCNGAKLARGINKRAKPFNARYEALDLFELKNEGEFDLALIIHPFPKSRYKEYGIAFRPWKGFIKRTFGLLKGEGVMLIVTYPIPDEEREILDWVPKKGVLWMGRFIDSETIQEEYKKGKMGYANNWILVARKSKERRKLH